LSEEKKTSSKDLIEKYYPYIIGLIILCFVVFILVPYLFFREESPPEFSNLSKWIFDNIYAVGFFVLLIYVLWRYFRGEQIQTWVRPGGIELLMRAIHVCPEFTQLGISWEDIPKNKNLTYFWPDRKNPVYYYYMRLKQEDNIQTPFAITYNPRKINDWDPRVSGMLGMRGADVVELAKGNMRVVFTEKGIIGDAIEEIAEEEGIEEI